VINVGRPSAGWKRQESPKVGHSSAATFVVCLLIFVDVPLPLFEGSNRLLGIVIVILLLFEGIGVRTRFCGTMFTLLPMYFLVPLLVYYEVKADNSIRVLIFELVSLGGMVLLARALADDGQRLKLTDMLVLFAVANATIAFLQRLGVLGPLGRDRWGYTFDAAGDLRGAGLLADPNFLAISLASVVPLIVSWRFAWLRAPALVILALGLYSTNSRAGIFLAALALLFSIVKRPPNSGGDAAKGRMSVVLVAICVLGLFVFNVGAQRDRVVEALLVEAGMENSVLTGDATDTFVAHERRQLLESWVNVGMDHFPFGAGSGERAELSKAAHNTFATLFGEGGIIGLAIAMTLLVCFIVFARRLSDPFAMMGAVIIIGSLFLSYLGSVLLVLPIGLADGILAAGLGMRAPAEPGFTT
jgi:hypothetical protein